MRGLWWSNPRPIHLAGGPQPRVACRLPQVLRMSDVPGRKLHLLRQGRQDILQEGLHEVSNRASCKQGMIEYQLVWLLTQFYSVVFAQTRSVLVVHAVPEAMHKARFRALVGRYVSSKSPSRFQDQNKRVAGRNKR